MSRETEAGHWYARMHGPDADSSRAAFNAWKRDPANAAAYAAYEEDWTLTGSITPAPRARSRSEREAARFSTGGARWAMATAAAALAVLVAWSIVPRGDTPQIAATPATVAAAPLQLADGTRVTLMDGARAVPLFSAGERRVRLEGGRARFDVAHDAARPFIVVAGHSETRALGTVFEVDARPSAPTVRLIQGAVEVRVVGSAQGLRLAPGESAEIAASGPHRLPALAAPVPVTMLDADHLPLGAVVARANQANAVPIRVTDPRTAALEVTGRFDVADSPPLARKLAAALDLAVETRRGEILLKPRE